MAMNGKLVVIWQKIAVLSFRVLYWHWSGERGRWVGGGKI